MFVRQKLTVTFGQSIEWLYSRHSIEKSSRPTSSITSERPYMDQRPVNLAESTEVKYKPSNVFSPSLTFLSSIVAVHHERKSRVQIELHDQNGRKNARKCHRVVISFLPSLEVERSGYDHLVQERGLPCQTNEWMKYAAQLRAECARNCSVCPVTMASSEVGLSAFHIDKFCWLVGGGN